MINYHIFLASMLIFITIFAISQAIYDTKKYEVKNEK
jgi:hypothetical protein